MVITLDDLLDLRRSYEAAFSEKGEGLSGIEIVLPDRDLGLSGHVLVAEKGNRRFQISVYQDAVPAAFFKRVGLDDETALLQIIVPPSDTKISLCERLFRRWMLEGAPENRLKPMLDEFSSAHR